MRRLPRGIWADIPVISGRGTDRAFDVLIDEVEDQIVDLWWGICGAVAEKERWI